MPGAEFELYTSDKDKNKIKKVFSGVADANGEMLLRDEEGKIITFASLYEDYDSEYFLLEETGIPPGYRRPTSVLLHYDPEDKVTRTVNLWESGAYCQPMLNSTMPLEIQYGSNGQKSIEDMKSEELNELMVFAVLFKRKDMNTPASKSDNWLPVYGNAIDGWEVAEKNTWENVLTAAKANGAVFDLKNGGAFVGVIENIPGDISAYYNVLSEDDVDDKAEFAVGYYYSTAEKSKDFTGIEEENTYYITNSKEFKWDFGSKLYMPNIKNRLLVHKVGDDGKNLADAEFSLYKKDQLTVNADGTIQGSLENITAYDTVVTEEELSTAIQVPGGAVFPSKKKGILEKGEYWLVETRAPEGYIKNPKAIGVVVNDTGVYADAGTAEDGVTVVRSLGTVLRSVAQLATNDIGYTTLHDVKTQLLIWEPDAGDKAEGSGKWSDWKQNPAPEEEMHLQYDRGVGLDYGLSEGEAEHHKDGPILMTDEGWSKLAVRQCLEHPNGEQGTKEKLGDTDLTNLFSGLITVEVTNQRKGGSTVDPPVDPDNPNPPVDPDDPDNPDKPDKPGNPDNPDGQNPQEKPDRPGKADQNSENGQSPGTGDSADLGFWTVLIGLQAAAVVFLYRKTKKRNDAGK